MVDAELKKDIVGLKKRMLKFALELLLIEKCIGNIMGMHTPIDTKMIVITSRRNLLDGTLAHVNRNIA